MDEIGLIVRSSNLVRSNMNKTNCEEIEEVRNNILNHLGEYGCVSVLLS